LPENHHRRNSGFRSDLPNFLLQAVQGAVMTTYLTIWLLIVMHQPAVTWVGQLGDAPMYTSYESCNAQAEEKNKTLDLVDGGGKNAKSLFYCVELRGWVHK
jgi:hypothetical protein